MDRTDPRYGAYLRILTGHLRPAMGCTEPIAIAYASALARRALGCLPEGATVRVSGNILKNAKSVTVPNTGGGKGIDMACAAGIVAGDADRELEVIAAVTAAQREAICAYLARGVIRTCLKADARLFDIEVEMHGGGHTALARIADRHTNVACVYRDGQALRQTALCAEAEGGEPCEEALLTIADIYDFAGTCELGDVREALTRQIRCNWRVAEEGMRGGWGACVGRVLRDSYGDGVDTLAKAYAAAGSDARMSGCELPVIINSGSGNQGITVSVPVIVYAREMGAKEDALLRALIVSNLTAIHVKTLIGCLSAYCGAVSAGCAAGAGIAYLQGGSLDVINHTIVNGLAILSGTICDGAKPSCAAKIAAAVDAALMGYRMAKAGKEFIGGEGIVKKGVENTIVCVGRLGKDGMRQTDEEILRIMIG